MVWLDGSCKNDLHVCVRLCVHRVRACAGRRMQRFHCRSFDVRIGPLISPHSGSAHTHTVRRLPAAMRLPLRRALPLLALLSLLLSGAAAQTPFTARIDGLVAVAAGAPVAPFDSSLAPYDLTYNATTANVTMVAGAALSYQIFLTSVGGLTTPSDWRAGDLASGASASFVFSTHPPHPFACPLRLSARFRTISAPFSRLSDRDSVPSPASISPRRRPIFFWLQLPSSPSGFVSFATPIFSRDRLCAAIGILALTALEC